MLMSFVKPEPVSTYEWQIVNSTFVDNTNRGL